ncbi:hypothetical protein Saga11_38370 [Bacillus safensis]|nr:hypothetical protein Saga11_38370 [Bacillus safensis]
MTGFLDDEKAFFYVLFYCWGRIGGRCFAGHLFIADGDKSDTFPAHCKDDDCYIDVRTVGDMGEHLDLSN